MKIATNNISRPMMSFCDLPLSIQSDFDYIENEDKYTSRFVQYKGHFYDVLDSQLIFCTDSTSPIGFAMVVQSDNPLAKYDAIVSESYFSGVLFKLSNNSENVICASYTS